MAAIERRARVRRREHPVQTGTFDTRLQAEAWARETEPGMDRGTFRDMRRAASTTLAQAMGGRHA